MTQRHLITENAGKADWVAMQREYPQLPLVGVGAIVIEHGRVLLIKRGKPPLEGQWSIPGGMLEIGEELRETGELIDV